MKSKEAVVEKLLFIQAEIREIKAHLYAVKKFIIRRHKHSKGIKLAKNKLHEQRNKDLQGKA